MCVFQPRSDRFILSFVIFRNNAKKMHACIDGYYILTWYNMACIHSKHYSLLPLRDDFFLHVSACSLSITERGEGVRGLQNKKSGQTPVHTN